MELAATHILLIVTNGWWNEANCWTIDYQPAPKEVEKSLPPKIQWNEELHEPQDPCENCLVHDQCSTSARKKDANNAFTANESKKIIWPWQFYKWYDNSNKYFPVILWPMISLWESYMNPPFPTENVNSHSPASRKFPAIRVPLNSARLRRPARRTGEPAISGEELILGCI